MNDGTLVPVNLSRYLIFSHNRYFISRLVVLALERINSASADINLRWHPRRASAGINESRDTGREVSESAQSERGSRMVSFHWNYVLPSARNLVTSGWLGSRRDLIKIRAIRNARRRPTPDGNIGKYEDRAGVTFVNRVGSFPTTRSLAPLNNNGHSRDRDGNIG